MDVISIKDNYIFKLNIKFCTKTKLHEISVCSRAARRHARRAEEGNAIMQSELILSTCICCLCDASLSSKLNLICSHVPPSKVIPLTGFCWAAITIAVLYHKDRKIKYPMSKNTHLEWGWGQICHSQEQLPPQPSSQVLVASGSHGRKLRDAAVG